MPSIWLLCLILYWLFRALMFWIGNRFPSLSWHMWKPCLAKHIIQPESGLGSQRICGCYATCCQAAQSGRPPLSKASVRTLNNLSSLLSFHHLVHHSHQQFYIPFGQFLLCHLQQKNIHNHAEMSPPQFVVMLSKAFVYFAYIYFYGQQWLDDNKLT